MSNGFAFWYEQDWTPQRAANRVASLDAAGLRLGHHKTGRITEISGDEDTAGQQIDSDRSSVLNKAAVQTDREVHFQYWIDVDIDVFCTIERLTSDLAVQRLYLDGLAVEQLRFVIGVVFDQVRAAPGSTRGLIVDRVGGSDNEDWDELIIGTTGRFAVRADAMVLPRAIAANHPELHAGPPGYVGDLVVYDPDSMLPTMPTS